MPNLRTILVWCVLTLACAPLCADRLVTDFEKYAPGPLNASQSLNPHAPGWGLRGPSGWASRMTLATEENVAPPNHYLRLDYDFTGGNEDGTPVAGAKYLIANCQLPLPAGTTDLSFRVLGDGVRHALVLSVLDATGQWFNFSVANTDWQGWRNLTVSVTSGWHSHGGGANDGVMHPPLALSSFNLTDRATSPQRGVLGFDDLTARTVSGNLFTGLGAHQLTWVLTNPTDSELRGDLSWRVVAFEASGPARPPQLGAVAWTCPPHTRAIVSAPVTARDYGAYWCDGALSLADAGGAYPFVTTFAAVPAPRPDPTLSFGAGVSFAQTVLSGELRRRLPRVHDLGASWSMAYLSWEKSEPEEGNFTWAALDRAMQDCHTPGVSLFGVLADAPPWAMERADFPALYARALSAAAGRWAPQVPIWGIVGTARYVAYEKVAQVMHEARLGLAPALPGLKLVGEMGMPGYLAPDAASWPPPPGAAEEVPEFYWDGLGPDQGTPLSQDAESARSALEAFRGRLGPDAAAQPLWTRNWPEMAELSTPSAAGPEAPPLRLTPALARPGEREGLLAPAGVLARLLITERALGVAHAAWALLNDYSADRSGLLTADGSPKPAACAFATVCDLLAGGRLLRDDSDAQARRLVFALPDGRQVLAAWKLGAAPAGVEIADPAAAEVVSLLGARHSAGPSHDPTLLPLTEAPVYVVPGQPSARPSP